MLEDYKPLDVECASVGLLLHRGIRERYPDWRYLLDGDGGDENLKDYPIEENPELTIRSVVNNLMLYQEGWGVGKIKHSLTYSGGLSRGYVRSYAPARRYGFEDFSPFTRPSVIEVAEGIPVRGADAVRRADALRPQGRDRPAWRPRRSPGATCRSFRSAGSSTAPCRPTCCTPASAKATADRPSASIAGSSWRSTPECIVAAYPATAACPRRLHRVAAAAPAGARSLAAAGRDRRAGADAARASWPRSSPCSSPAASAPGAARCATCGSTRPRATRPPAPSHTRFGPPFESLPAVAQAVRPAIKLYNAGSFFDPRAVPPADYRAIACGGRRILAGDRRVASRADRAARGRLARRASCAKPSIARRGWKSRWGSRRRTRRRSSG